MIKRRPHSVLLEDYGSSTLCHLDYAMHQLHFSALWENVLRDVIGKICLVYMYMDVVIVFSKTPEEHIENPRIVY